MCAERSEVDYVIVGAGSAGCVLANRLSADGDARVLVLEAGGADRSWLIRVPLGVGKVWYQPEFNWSYNSEPEPNLDGRSVFHPRGKVLGGSSSINMMAYVRGNRGDYDRWRQKGLDGWAYADVLPYFKRAEAFEGPADGFHGRDGPLRTQVNKSRDPLYAAFLEAGVSAGYRITPDYNGAEQEGFARMQVSVGDGRRYSTAVAYLRPALARPNLAVETGALVTRVLVEGGRARGIEYVKDGRTATVHAAREVILSGGSINSPQVLMLSGIGPADHLRETGIEAVHDLPGVGANLQDHPAIGIEVRTTMPSELMRRLRYDLLAFDMVRARLLGTGPAASPPSAVTAFVKSGPEVAIPDIQLFFRPASYNAQPWLPLIRPSPPPSFTIRACHLRPESRGTVRLASADPAAKARIQNNFLATETDRRTLREAVRLMRRLAAQPAFDAVRGEEIAPGPSVETDAEIDAYVRQGLATVYHPISTCRMGSDQDSVVDLEFKVRGIEGLRVIDASVMPDLVGGNINAVVIMIAERAADALLGRPTLPRAEV